MESLKMNIDIDMSRDMQSDQLHELEAYDIRKIMSRHIYMYKHHIYMYKCKDMCQHTRIYNSTPAKIHLR